MRADDYFAREWPDEARRLRRVLVRNGVAADDVDDVVQETAARIYAGWNKLFDGRPLRPLVTTIALNVARDLSRRAVHAAHTVETFPEDLLVASDAVDAAAIARLEVARTARALQRLPAVHRRALAQAVTEDLRAEESGRSRAPAAVRMARTRARRQLVAALELTPAIAAVLAGAVRRRSAVVTVHVGLALACGALFLSSLGGGPGDRRIETAAEPRLTAQPAEPDGGASAAADGQASRYVFRITGQQSYSGVGSWSSGMPLLSASLFGTHAELGGRATGAGCVVRVADRIVVVLRCPPFA